MGEALGAVSGIVGVASGISNLFGGDSGGGGTSGGTGPTQAMTPWWMSGFGGNAAQQLNTLLQGGPSGVIGTPGFQQFSQGITDQTQRQAAASGMLASGNELAALQSLNRQNAMSYWQSMVNTLGNAAGMQFSPTGAAATNLQTQMYQDQLRGQSLGAITQGLSGLGGVFQGYGGTGASVDMTGFYNPNARTYTYSTPGVSSDIGGMNFVPDYNVGMYGG